MARRIREVRRAELSQAAFETLVLYGTRGATLERVAARAGVSKGVVLHHFGDKDALFVAVTRRANTLLRDGVIELLRRAETPLERLAAILVGNFAEHVFHQEVCHVWISLCAEAPYNADSQRIQAVIHARMRSNLRYALKPILGPDALDTTVFQINNSIDGIWLRASLQEEPMTSRQGIDHAVAAVRSFLGDHPERNRDLDLAIEKMEALAELILNSRAFTRSTAIAS